MGLPQIALPKYEITLPDSGKTIFYRPFVVKEEKLLLIAMEEGGKTTITNALKHVLNGCTYNSVNIEKLSKIDIEYLFVKVRNKSMGEGVDAVSECVHCGHKNYMTLDFDSIDVEWPEIKIDSIIQLDNNIWIKMRHPNIDSMYEFDSAESFDEIISAMILCVESVITGDSVTNVEDMNQAELKEWLENIPDPLFMKISDYLRNVPVLVFKQEYSCVKCEGRNKIHLEGLESFFG